VFHEAGYLTDPTRYQLFDPVRRVFIDPQRPSRTAPSLPEVAWNGISGIAVSTGGERYALLNVVRSWSGDVEYRCHGKFVAFVRGTTYIGD